MITLKKEKHMYIAAGACMMLILLAAVLTFYMNIQAAHREAKLSPDQAKEIALTDAGESIGDVTFTRTKLEWKSSQPIYYVDFYSDSTSYEYEINGQTGIVRERGQESLNLEITDHLADTGSFYDSYEDVIGVKEAQKIALEALGLEESQVTFTKTSLDTEDDVLVYEVKLLCDGRKYECTIEAFTGAIVEAEDETEDSDDIDRAPAPASGGSASQSPVYTDDDDDDDDDDAYYDTYDDDDNDAYDSYEYDDDDRYEYDDDDDDKYEYDDDDDDDDKYEYDDDDDDD